MTTKEVQRISRRLLRGSRSYDAAYWERLRRARHKSYKRAVPRSDEPWTRAEDRRLLRATVKLSKLPLHKRTLRWNVLAEKFERSVCALRTRASALQAGLRLCSHSEKS